MKEIILRGVEQELKGRKSPRTRVTLPIIRSKKPGATKLDNAKIFEIIPFP